MKILLFGDDWGLPLLLNHIPYEKICGIIGASIRPEQKRSLIELSRRYKLPFFMQPRKSDQEYVDFKEFVRDIAPDMIWVNSYSMVIGVIRD